MLKKLKLNGSRKTYKTFQHSHQRCPFHHRELECKIGGQQVPEVADKLGLEVRDEAGERLTEFCQENALVIANTLFQQHKRELHMNVTRWSILKSDWLCSLQQRQRALYSQQKQDLELTVAQIMHSILQNSGLNWRKYGKPLTIQVWPKSNPLWLYSGGDK